MTNWAEYDAALRQRGSLTIWFSEEAIAAWWAEPRRTRGGQPHYSADLPSLCWTPLLGSIGSGKVFDDEDEARIHTGGQAGGGGATGQQRPAADADRG